MSDSNCLLETNLDGKLPLIARGKVRDIYQFNYSQLLFVATDRISAYDVILNNGIPEKGKLLTQLSEFWFNFFKNDIKNHLSIRNLFFRLKSRHLFREHNSRRLYQAKIQV